jgi:phthalate 4,5-dioxygenase
MLSHEENARLTETNAGTPMGEYFRRYWLPAMLSSELPMPDGEPVRLRLLGENLIAFRDSNGREPFAAHHGDVYWVRSASTVLKRDVPFEDGCRSLLAAEV